MPSTATSLVASRRPSTRSRPTTTCWSRVLAGVGPVFCAGADLKAVARGEGLQVTTERGGFAGFVERERTKTVIAAIDGPAAAGGAEIATACDLVVASTAASLAITEVKRALIASGGSLFRLLHLGFVNDLVEPGQAVTAAIALGSRLAVNAPIAVRESRPVVLAAQSAHDEELWTLTRQGQSAAVASEDIHEGPRAFIEERAPRWTGRRGPPARRRTRCSSASARHRQPGHHEPGDPACP